ncbi:MAG: hypothetical protein ACOC33_00560 [bacterium]
MNISGLVWERTPPVELQNKIVKQEPIKTVMFNSLEVVLKRAIVPNRDNKLELQDYLVIDLIGKEKYTIPYKIYLHNEDVGKDFICLKKYIPLAEKKLFSYLRLGLDSYLTM